MKVSFDFDSTLSKQSVQNYASELFRRGIEVHIVTSRFKEPGIADKSEEYNYDLFSIAIRCMIPYGRIHFTNGEYKSEFFKDHPDFAFHLDDDYLELRSIQRNTTVKAISCSGTTNWVHKCNTIVEKELRKEWAEKYKKYVEEGEDEQMLPDFLDSEADELL